MPKYHDMDHPLFVRRMYRWIWEGPRVFFCGQTVYTLCKLAGQGHPFTTVRVYKKHICEKEWAKGRGTPGVAVYVDGLDGWSYIYRHMER